MASVKIVLVKHKKKKDGTVPIAVRVTKNRKTSYIFTGNYIFEKEWNATERCLKKSHPNSTRLNNLLQKKLSEAHASLLDAETSNENLSTKQIANKVKRKGSGVSFFEAAAERIERKYKAGTFSVAKSEMSILYNIAEYLNLNSSAPMETVIKQIQERRKKRMVQGRKPEHSMVDDIKLFTKKKTLPFEEIDTAFLNKYKSFCAAYLGQKTRTITNQLIFIRTLFNQVITDGEVDRKHYPFAGDKEKIKITSGHKIGLTREEILRIEDLNLEMQTSIWHTRNVWLFSFYFAGIRISDVLEMKWSDFKDGRLFYTMNKNEKPVSLKIPKKAKDIIRLYENRRISTDNIFPFLDNVNPKSEYDKFVKIRNASSLFDKYLKRIGKQCGIEKNLSNHIARHSFGNIAGDSISPYMLQKLYRHSDLKTTIGYQANFIHKEADEALDAVINF
ncbi:tyrosine-type recombinase/integrase [Maribacter sp. ACAM166]|uniref:tyrosine-type recombinase/integrase n=1 Tax=Maribacter sp. ACAM166 TaxID=2508996 RepID=UPI0010FD53C0|nr:tyrosine-type recombinase/integrase [Maribacter sp. ACAM166]TLP74166.1 site-specific integrase [Maribacter sp. ACAM166]